MVRRGDVYWASPPKIGKQRFLIVQDDSFNRNFNGTLAVPIVSKKEEKINSWEVKVPDDILPKPSIINCSAIILLECSDLGDFVCTLDKRIMQGVNYGLSVVLGLQDW